MYSRFSTPDKQYLLEVDKFICNKFGLAEFFAENYCSYGNIKVVSALDVGCGALPLGIFLADQYKYKVTGVELNPIACNCAKKNIKKFNIENLVKVINDNFAAFAEKYVGKNFDMIVANPPVDSKVENKDILKYANETFEILDDESFSYLTNSWHSVDGKDLIDYIFEFGKKKLKQDGRIILVFCTIDCISPDYVFEKADKYNYDVFKVINGYVSADSIGA